MNLVRISSLARASSSGRSAPSTVGYRLRKWAANAAMTASRGSWVWERTGSTRLFALAAHFRDRYPTVDGELRPEELARATELMRTKFTDPAWTARVP